MAERHWICRQWHHCRTPDRSNQSTWPTCPPNGPGGGRRVKRPANSGSMPNAPSGLEKAGQLLFPRL
eukprot:671582-Lingulodinium_polyedra.AAC.1